MEGEGMEVDPAQPMEVRGKLFHFNKGAAFFSFPHDGGEEEVCLFRPNKLVVAGRRLGASCFKSVEAIGKVMAVGEEVGAVVVPHTEAKSYLITDPSSDKREITPCWYAQAVWKGERPEDLGRERGARGAEEEVVIDNVPGRIVHNRLAARQDKGGKGAGQTFVSFTNPEGRQDLAMFRNLRCFYVDGERARPDLIALWPEGKELEVKFTAVHTPSLREYVTGSTSFRPQWRVRLMWTGERPAQAVIDAADPDRALLARGRRDKTEFLETIKDCEYLCARLERIVSTTEGVLMLRSKAIAFHISNLSIDGQSFGADGDLREVLEVGENLFAYVKACPGRVLEEFTIQLEAKQIWKGKRSLSVSEETKAEKKKTPIPLPEEASHRGVVGRVVEVEGPGLGYLALQSDDPALAGARALFSRNRLYIHGAKLRFKDSILEHLAVGDLLELDMVRADPEEAEGEYQWMAVLTWQGTRPSADLVDEISKKIENYRAKVLMFDDWSREQGHTSGILQVMGGSSKIGERAFFSREQVFVFGARMARADLAHVLRVGDKVQLEVEALEEPVTRFGVEIRYRASLVWVGPPPRLEEPCDDFPRYVGNVILPFITKRGFTEEDFGRLVRGEMAPKAREEGAAPSATTPRPKAPLVLPPNTIFGKVVELKKPEASSASGTEHGLLQIENGPWEKGRAFFNRNCLFCWGHNCAKADLMYLITDGDKFCVEVADGTNNKAVPYKVTAAWIGPHPHEKNKEAAAMAGNPHFMKWCKEHGLTVDLFRQVVAGEAPHRPFFPLLGPQHQAKVAALFPSAAGADAGLLRLFQGHPHSKEGRKAPEVLFERETVYIWNVQMAGGDLNYVLQENDKVFVEVADLIGKEKKKWQARLGQQAVPKFIATLVFVGGGRPKAERAAEDTARNANLVQWLNKRNMDVATFDKLVAGRLPPKVVTAEGEDSYGVDYTSQASFTNLALALAPGPGRGQGPGRGRREGGASPLAFPGGGWGGKGPYTNPIMRQAEELTQRTMLLQSPEDPEVTNLITDDSEAQLALFLSKTLTNAIMMYRQGGPGPIGPPAANPGPIGPPRGGQGGPRGARGAELHEFYADSSLAGGRGGAGRGGGLYGLSEPLLQYRGGEHRPPEPPRGPPDPLYRPGGPEPPEPPYKRKYENGGHGEW